MLAEIATETATRLRHELEQIQTIRDQKQIELEEAEIVVKALKDYQCKTPIIETQHPSHTCYRRSVPTPLHDRVEYAIRAVGVPLSPTEILDWLLIFEPAKLTGLPRQRARTQIATALTRKTNLFRKVTGTSKWSLIEWDVR